MKCLVRRWMFAVAVLGLMVGGPLLADDNPTLQPPTAVFFKALATAEANVKASADGKLPNGKALPREVVSSLTQVAAVIDQSKTALAKVYPEGFAAASSGRDKLEESGLENQIARSMTQLSTAMQMVSGFEASDPGRVELLTAKETLNLASSELARAQKAIVAAEAQDEHKDVPHRVAWHSVASVLAILLAVVAIVLVFLRWGPVAKLQEDKTALQGQLKSLTSQHSILREDLESLSKQKDDLSKKIKKLTDSAKVTDQVPQEEWTTKERRTYERRRSTGVGGGAGASGAAFVESTRESSLAAAKRANVDEASEEDDLRALPVKAVPKARVPLADYNDARAKKPADRATEFSQQYAKQTAMTCSNPQVRNNGAFTDLRFREDQLGKFLAVEHGKELLLFPELNYDYSTGRKTLEGVFQYPDVESTAYRLTQPATVEKRGEEWALTRQGVFQNG